MKNYMLLVFIYGELLYGALPPRYQNTKDLNVMTEFIKTHSIVSSSLKLLDMRDYTILFGNNCKVKFTRKEKFRPTGWCGPAEALEFKSSTCKFK
jgi:hypothetical protein